MSLINALFGVDCFFKESSVVGLSGLRKRTEYVRIEVPREFKKTYITNTENNYLLI